MGFLDKAVNRDGAGGFVGGLIRLILRFFQFVLALTVAGLYGTVCFLCDPSQAFLTDRRTSRRQATPMANGFLQRSWPASPR